MSTTQKLFNVFGVVVYPDNRRHMLPNAPLDLSNEKSVRAQLLAAFPGLKKFNLCILDLSQDEYARIVPKWVRKCEGHLCFRPDEKIPVQRKKRFKVKKGFKWENLTFKRGQFVSLLPNDPRLEDWREKRRI